MFAAPPSNPSKPKLAEVNVSISYNEGGQFFVESCGAVNGTLTFTLEADPTEERKYLVNLLGSATPLVDYNITGLTDTITFAPGQTQLVFPIIVTMDILSELDEDINVTVIDLLNQVFISSAQAEIHDSFTPKINNGQDITVCRGAEISSALMKAVLVIFGALLQVWTIPLHLLLPTQVTTQERSIYWSILEHVKSEIP